MQGQLSLEERVKNTILLGESHFREFKSAFEGPTGQKKPRAVKSISKEVAEALVAFSNADGGEILIGVEDDRSVTGVPLGDREIKDIISGFSNYVFPGQKLPILEATPMIVDGLRIIYFSCAKSATEIFQLSDGRCVRRQDLSTVPEQMERIVFERREMLSRSYDRSFVEAAGLLDLELDLVRSIADRFLSGISVERYLQQLGLADFGSNGIRLRMAALLLFAKDIRRWHPGSTIRVVRVDGNELGSGESYNVVTDEFTHGNLFELLDKGWELLRPFLADRTSFGRDAKFQQRFIYPELACREALVNAIAHRDYSLQTGIEVMIFNDRMEFRNPGGLLSTITIKQITRLAGHHESRNALVSKVLREAKFMRELGEGMRRIFALLSENEMQAPNVKSTNDRFTLAFANESVYDERQREWLNLFSDFSPTKLQKRILVLGIGNVEFSPNDIHRAMGTNDRDVYDREVTGLRVSGLLSEIRSNLAAKKYARSNNIPPGSVPRFAVNLPGKASEGALGKIRSKNHSVFDEEKAIFVSKLSPEVSEEDVIDLLSKLGTVTRYVFPKDPKLSFHRGYAFVEFSEKSQRDRAIDILNGNLFLGTRISVRRYVAPVPK